ncbi:CRISPR-associated helicase Cas3' [Lactiplantibacillus pentosus]|uniref:CRISPR-associated helicase Cas3' n=1 Tax=Lactiplantibacillus pentosus TaxID=1589 RepID=UPI001933367B|nr:CRISPR-associated helicase Cas3' [Lactiplantibacillus pentosus]
MAEFSRLAQSLWAKKRSSDGQRLWLPLIVHLKDCENTINWLFNHWLSDGQRQQLAAATSEEDVQKLVKFLGFIHDCGKATPAFQMKPAYNGDNQLDQILIEQLMRSGFKDLDVLNLSSAQRSPHALAGEAILTAYGVDPTIGAIIGGHHGKPESEPPVHQIRDYTANYFQSDNRPELQVEWQQVQRELVEYGLHSAGYQRAAEIPAINQPEAVILTGLLIMADWLASSECFDGDASKPLFPLVNTAQSVENIDVQTRFQRAIMTWRLDDEWVPAPLSQDQDPYQLRWGFHARPVQAAITRALGATTDPGMAIIEAPMGLGKTEIALIAVEQLARMTGRDGVYMGLPTQATTNAMFARVNDWLASVADEQEAHLSIKLMHGKSQFNRTYTALPNASNVNSTDEHHGAVTLNSWFSGKKSILTKFTVGTIDNLLLMGLKQKHLFLRHLGFSGKVVVIDEVHAYDAYMNAYLLRAIEWLGAYHVPIVILSATLPKIKRNQLLKAYLKGKYGRKFHQLLKLAPAGWEDTQAYPLLSVLDGPEIKQVTHFEGQSDQAALTLAVERTNQDDQDLVATLLAQLDAGGVAGIIVNTVKRAQVLAALIPADVPLMVLHSAFLAPDRAQQEEKLQAAIGKHGQRPAKLVVIGTQVLEQSLDIDFDVLYTDIAPIDLILQRAGRLHRHQTITRPKQFRQPQLKVMGIKDFGDYGDGNEAVYGKYLLMKTDHFLPDKIQLPGDISTLVQRVYDAATDAEVPEIEPAAEKFETNLKAEQQKAGVFQVKAPQLKQGKTLHGWLDRDHTDVVNNQQASAAVRDIQETLEVILVQHTTDGDFLLDGRKLAEVASAEIAQQTLRIPAAITPNITAAITELEDLTRPYHLRWQDDVWLNGALVLPLDQNLTATFNGWQVSYSPQLGLSYSKEE